MRKYKQSPQAAYVRGALFYPVTIMAQTNAIMYLITPF